MAVDEFGREIPAPRGGQRSPSPPHRHRHHLHDGFNGGGVDMPSHLNDSLPTSRYEDRGNDRDYDRSSSRKRKQRSQSPPPHRSRSPPPPMMSSRRGGGRERSFSGDRGSGKDRNSNSKKSNSKPHPSTIYVEEPMLCNFLWKEQNDGKTEEDYDDYRKSYCLNYVRTFFNEHMDNSWFRAMYSPLEHYHIAQKEKKRAGQEAKAFADELESSLTKTISNSSSSNGSSSNNNGETSFFVLKARLGGGIRQTVKVDESHGRRHNSPTKFPRQSSLVNPTPTTHVLALTSQVLPIREIPHYVTDEQLTVSLIAQVSSKTSKTLDPDSMVLFSGPPALDLTRSAYLQVTSEVRKEIIQSLNNSDRGGGAKVGGSSHVPRKEDTFLPKTLELIVECSDAYGRLEVDADGKGGEPEERGGVPSRKASVWLSTKPLSPHVQVLSAALSSRKRIQEDQAAALKLAKAYDNKQSIPSELRLENLLPKIVPNIANDISSHSKASVTDDEGNSNCKNSPPSQNLEDALDVTIAYLRRVHLISYYNGCQSADQVANVFNGNSAASTIHLRLSNADELLEPIPNDSENKMVDGLPKKDLLVQRLEESIESALEKSEKWNKDTNTDQNQDSLLTTTCIVVNEETDREAKNIEYQQSQVEGGWIEDHSSIDADGRARCAFHFCRKLFKDSTFLRKHLIKKHSEFLRADVAKCHDSYMMSAWDSQEQRPVPPILVDCGKRFGVRPSPVLGSSEPIAIDPEPELWRVEEQRREETEKRREQYKNNQTQLALDAPLSEDRGYIRNNDNNTRSNFVDVDDMKEEKVEIAFDTIEIPLQPPKKKKKKKKLL